MIPVQMGALKHDVGHNGKDGQRYALLNDFQLYEGEWSAVVDKAHPVSWYLAAVFKEGYCP